MSVLQTLTEGIVGRNLKKEGAALLEKWDRTGLLEGLNSDQEKSNMARLLENQAAQLLKEATSMAAGDVEGFASVAFPIVRRVFAGLVANDLVSVQPMSLPSGLIFFMDFVYDKARFGNRADESIYGTDQVASQITGGVDLVGSSLKEDLGGFYGMGGTYASATGSVTIEEANTDTGDLSSKLGTFELDAGLTQQQKKLLLHDPDVLSLRLGSNGEELADGSMTHQVNIFRVAKASLAEAGTTDTLDTNNLSAITISQTSLDASDMGSASSAKQIRRLTQIDPDDDTKILLYVVGTAAGMADKTEGDGISGSLDISFPIRDNFDQATALGAVVGNAPWGLEGAADSAGTFNGNNVGEIPEINIKVDSIAVTAQTKKLKAKWTPELGQDLNAYHNLDAEVELTSILSEQIALEIDRELLQDLVNGATAGTLHWSRRPGQFLDRHTGAKVTASTAPPDFTGTVSEWYETLVETINDVSAQIHRKTLRGGANFLVCSPEVANVLEFTSGFRASVVLDEPKGNVGAVKAGAISKKFDVYVDPYFHRAVILVGRKGASFLESGYVYAPYVPLQVTPTIFGTEDFVPRKGVMTRYAKKMVRPDMYGLVMCHDLLG